MNTAKHLKDSNWQPSLRRQYRFSIKVYLPAMLLSALLGTYLDLLMIGKHFYEFPYRPFPAVFSLNILFTLLVLPLMMMIFLFIMDQLNFWRGSMLILFLSLAMSVLEKLTENFGFFVHSVEWSHFYTFIGYCLYLIIITTFHSWLNDNKDK